MAQFLGERDTFVMRQVLLDFSLPQHAAQIGGLIAMHVNFESGVAEVSISTIADATGLSTDTVSRAIQKLDKAGHLRVQYGRGRGQTHRIGWIVKPETRSDGFRGLAHENIVASKGRGKNPASERGFVAEENPAGQRGFMGENSADQPRKPRYSAAKTPLASGPNTQVNTLTNTQGVGALSARPTPLDVAHGSASLVDNDAGASAHDAPSTRDGHDDLLEDFPPVSASYSCVGDEDQDGRPLTLEDLARIDAEERAAAETREAALLGITQQIVELHAEDWNFLRQEHFWGGDKLSDFQLAREYVKNIREGFIRSEFAEDAEGAAAAAAADAFRLITSSSLEWEDGVYMHGDFVRRISRLCGLGGNETIAAGRQFKSQLLNYANLCGHNSKQQDDDENEEAANG